MKISRFIFNHRFMILSVIAGLVVLATVALLFSVDDSTNTMVVKYIEGFGWEVEDSPAEISHLTLPRSFDAVYEVYNSLQKSSGFDLEGFRGKKVTRYTYRVTNHRDSQHNTVLASVFIYNKTIIGADISSADSNGFMHAITDVSKIRS